MTSKSKIKKIYNFNMTPSRASLINKVMKNKSMKIMLTCKI